MFVMLILAVCLKYDVDFISENTLHKYILKYLTKLKLALKESISVNFIKSE